MRLKQLVLVTVAALAPAVLGGLPAGAADTTVTFTVTSGALTITAPAGPVSLGSTTAGNTVSGPLGAVTVTDARGGTPTADWTAQVSSTAFVGPTDTIPASAATYTPGSGTLVVGNGTLTPGVPGNLSAQRVAMTYTGGTGNSQATWSPTLTVAVPLAVGLGTYTGTVTHSVA
ncbi:hypothetical protein GCM10009530_42690 [Microbispora corallina]|uniref:WxL domain-containing protein n=1 Tax=Microbispora corallina TaxID=83302 RepID=A0ABQ4G173_9ACTN|nr:hypothetical protein [Microbispora corallina]GIH40802.1 hypothetical protein Mco01_38020 [Microbispora corallina]